MKKNTYSSKIGQFKLISKKINELLENGRWENLDNDQKSGLVKKLNQLFNEVKHYFTARKLKRTVALASFLIFGLGAANAQTFADPVDLGVSIGSVPSATLADIDGDGDQDLIIGSYYGGVDFYENTGTAQSASFAAAQTSAFGAQTGSYSTSPAFADMDNDGDLDLFCSDFYGELYYFENIGTSTNPSFGSPSYNPFGFSTPIAANLFGMIDLADMDNDGDYDLLYGSFYLYYYGSAVVYYENVGTPTAASFASSVDLGLDDNRVLAKPSVGDIDLDGDLDLMVGTFEDLIFYRNTGSASSSPVFANAMVNPFNLDPKILYYVLPAFADLDADGDQDLISSGYDWVNYDGVKVLYQQNLSITTSLEENNLNIGVYPQPVSNVVNFEFEKVYDVIEVEVVDVTGKVVLNGDFEKSSSIQLNLESLETGAYSARLILDGDLENLKLVKN